MPARAAKVEPMAAAAKVVAMAAVEMVAETMAAAAKVVAMAAVDMVAEMVAVETVGSTVGQAGSGVDTADLEGTRVEAGRVGE